MDAHQALDALASGNLADLLLSLDCDELIVGNVPTGHRVILARLGAVQVKVFADMLDDDGTPLCDVGESISNGQGVNIHTHSDVQNAHWCHVARWLSLCKPDGMGAIDTVLVSPVPSQEDCDYVMSVQAPMILAAQAAAMALRREHAQHVAKHHRHEHQVPNTDHVPGTLALPVRVDEHGRLMFGE